MTSKSNERKNPQRGEEQHQHHKNPSEGSPKQVPPLGVFTKIPHKSNCLCSCENYAHKYQMTGVHGSCTPANWPKTHKNTITILLQIKSFTEIPHKSSWLCSRENYTQKYDLTKWSAADHLLNWPPDSRKDDLDPLADKKHVI